MQVPSSEKWRQANKPVRTFLGLNPWLLFIYLIALFGAKYAFWTAIITATVLTVFFATVEYKGVPAFMALRWLRTQVTKRKKKARPSWVKL